MQVDTPMLIAALSVPAVMFIVIFLFKRFAVSTPEGHETLSLRFGKLHHHSTDAGLVGVAKRLVPYDSWITVSRQWDERIYREIETNDHQGTIVKVDLRLTFRIVSGEKALFAVDDWESALQSTALHEAAAQLAGKDRSQFLRCAPDLVQHLTSSIKNSMTTYGIEVGDVRIMNVEFRPEVTRQMFETVAAKLEVAKAEYEERGRTDAALLLARTEQQVAELEAKAKTESLKAVGRAYQELRARTEVFEAYEHLYRLSQLDPSRVVSFDGFDEGELSRAAIVESDLERDDSRAPQARKPGPNSLPT
jgi:regulator of protease activity HflC (stomatin/prohibitin superfamily)